MKKNQKTYHRGDVLLVDFSPVIGCEQADVRPAVIISNDLFHRLHLVTVAAITSRIIKSPGRVLVCPDEGNGLKIPSDVLAFQVRTISTKPERILKKLGRLSFSDIDRINEALKLTLNLST